MNVFRRFVLPGLFLAGRLGAGSDPWAQLKVGMGPEATIVLLGAPMLQTRGHGMETWIYEHGAEVLMRGNVAGWTLPPEALRPPLTTAVALELKKPIKLPVPAAPPQKPPACTKAEGMRFLRAPGSITSPPP